jgi:sugar phosphate isomerase/epimerase
MMGDGVIELHKLRELVDSAGYEGPIEVEIFNEAVWRMPENEVMDLIGHRFLEHVG